LRTASTVDLAYRDVVRGYLPEPGLVAQDIQAQLAAELGITVNIRSWSPARSSMRPTMASLTMYLLGWGADYPDQTNFLDYHFGAGASPQFGAGFPDITRCSSRPHRCLTRRSATSSTPRRTT
jgi:peptide/nickel transport system substrate-binding protein